MNQSKGAIFVTIFSCMSQGKNHYSCVSIAKILKLLHSHHKIDIKRRWLFQCIRDMIDKGLLSRKSRHVRDSQGHIEQIPSMLTFTIRGARYLVSKRVSGAFKLLKSMLKFVSGGDKRWPHPKDVAGPAVEENFRPSRDDWKKLFGRIGRSV